MRSWSSPAVPTGVRDRFGDGPAVAVFDTRTGAVETTKPGQTARLYVCGITPYDATHLGHALTYVTFDLLHRAWQAAGHDVRYVQNVTDVDDPLLTRADETGIDWVELAERETQLFREDMASLAVLPPDVYAGAVESVPLIVELIEVLQRRGAVYQVDDDLYFEIATDPAFGRVGNLDRAAELALFTERGGDPDRPGKRDPIDCLVWQQQRPGEPAWKTVLGTGRPGWHVECAAIARTYLGTAFDVQGGGSDLVFPHHEMCASEAHVAYPDVEFAMAYVHVGMLQYEGHKMSKSRGNLVLVSGLRADGVDPRAIRLGLLSHHYRECWEWSDQTLDEARDRLARWETALGRGGPDPVETVHAVRSALADDLDAVGALRAIDDWASRSGGDAAANTTANARVIADLASSSLGLTLSSVT